ncbi:tRNA lysidine(34) synthetase TilS [Enterobacterales bacterium endosymbiont of Anomoneura mori]|uniref:tRNA lysidine(34) synthetase TilS n=1 Tax=Enterobacterales bacterium endosymbiont of Anomoneura mori TaxID=3132096 RepID=UPI00399D14F5
MKNNYLINEVIKNIKNGKKYLIAFSGGLDSSALLHILFYLKKKYFKNIKLRAIHINHNLNINSNIWEKKCSLFCKERNIKLIIKNVNITKKSNLEENARKLRYNIFKKIILKNEILLLAHHLQDQCETFFLALKRGSGPSGLSCMPLKKKNFFYILRPFLNINKKIIKKFVYENKIKYIEDDSNYNIKFDRNYLRLKILPLLEKRWPEFFLSISKSIFICVNQEKIIYNFFKKKIIKIQNKKKALSINYLKKISLFKCFLLIRYWLNQFNINKISLKMIKTIWYEIALSNLNAKPKIKSKIYQINRYSNYIYLLPNMYNIKNIVMNWSLNEPLILPNNIGKLIISKTDGYILQAPKKNQKVKIKFFLKGLYYIIGKKYSSNIKKIWKELGIAPWLRNRIPLLFYDDKFISAIGVFNIKNNFLIKKKIIIKIIK